MKVEKYGGIERYYKKIYRVGLDLMSVLAKQWLREEIDNSDLISVIKQADSECGSGGCDFDALYKRALELLNDSVSTIKNTDK